MTVALRKLLVRLVTGAMLCVAGTSSYAALGCLDTDPMPSGPPAGADQASGVVDINFSGINFLNFTIDVWRQTCSPQRSRIFARLTFHSGAMAMICGSPLEFYLVQDGRSIQITFNPLNQEIGGGAVCSATPNFPATGLVTEFGFPLQVPFDRDRAFTLVYRDPVIHDGVNDYLLNLPARSGGIIPPANQIVAVEYYHAEFNHYFVTANNDEISKLDNGAFSGWTRTGKSFKVLQIGAGGVSVCRFFSASFAPRSSHFYTPVAPECATVKQNTKWTFEGDVFAAELPDATGSCPAGMKALYRLYNNGMSGAPNHRYVTEASDRATMISHGWISEGWGNLGVIACIPT